MDVGQELNSKTDADLAEHSSLSLVSDFLNKDGIKQTPV